MASQAKYTVATGSDEESHSTAVVPRQVRVAHRVAAAALLASAATFAVVAAGAARGAWSSGPAVAPAPVAAGGGAGMVGLAAAPGPAAAGVPHAHRTTAPSAIYLERSTSGEKVSDLPAGTVLLPMKRAAGGWVQAVVPKQQGQPGTMGWLHAPDGLDRLLAPEPRALQTRRPRVATMTKAQLSQKWEMLHTKNDENKARLVALQSGMQRHLGEKAADAGVQAVSAGAAKLHLRQGVDALRKEVKKELAAGGAKGIIGDLAKVFH